MPGGSLARHRTYTEYGVNENRTDLRDLGTTDDRMHSFNQFRRLSGDRESEPKDLGIPIAERLQQRVGHTGKLLMWHKPFNGRE